MIISIDEKKYRAIADEMYEAYDAVIAGEREGEESEFGVQCEDFFLCHPWYDETMRFEVDPLEHYGSEAFFAWLALASKFKS